MKRDSRNISMGRVEIIFRSPKDSERSSKNISRSPKILNKKIFLPNDHDIEVVRFPDTTECLVLAGAGVFPQRGLQVLWCGERIGRPFIFGFTSRVIKIGKDGDRRKFLNFIKPKRTTSIEVYKETGTPEIYDTVWLTKLPSSYNFGHQMNFFETLLFGRVKEVQGVNHLGYETFLNHTQISAQYGIKEFKLGSAWCAIANCPTIHCSSTYDAKLRGHYYIEPSRYQVYLPWKLKGR